MNALELATEIERNTHIGGADNIYTQAAAMLRKQAEEIETLKQCIKDSLLTP
jgi:hypothetical protein